MRVLELNDAGLRLFDGERLLLDSPGIAALDGRHLLAGEAARARARLDPRRAHDRFWYQLDATLVAPLGEARTAADLAHAHLQSLREALTGEPLLIAAPGSFTPAQLGVLLGLLQAIGARAVGLVDSAVAAAGTVPTHARVLHVDVQLHRVVCTWLEGAGELARVRVEELKPGLSAMHDRCASAIAAAFVRHARFDPLHNAVTEQALYDRLAGWIARLAREPSAVLEMDSGARTHRVSLAHETLEDALAERIDALAEALLPQVHAQGASVLLSERAAALPGLAARFAPAQILDAAAAARGALEHLARIQTDDSDLAWITRLPRRALAAAAGAHTQPTHVLLGARARRLPAAGQSQALSAWLPGAPGLLRQTDEGPVLEDAAGSAVRLNGEPLAAARTLKSGDRVSCAGQDLRLIEVDGP